MNKRREVENELVELMDKVSDEQIEKFEEVLEGANRIFTSGMGRSGFMMRGFAMRLMHMGYKTYVVGETTTPAILEGDLLVLGSGSGKTSGLVAMAKKAKEMGAKIALISSNDKDGIAELADVVITVGAQTKDKSDSGSSIQPMGTLFEQGLLLVCDSVILDITEDLDTDGAEMYKNHANLE